MPVQVSGSGPLPEVPKIADSVKEKIADKLDLDNKLSAILGTGGDEDDNEPVETETPTGDEPAATPAAEEPAETPTGEEEPAEAAETAAAETNDKAGTAANGKTPAPTFPAAYRRSLKAYDWTDEEIDEAAKQPGFLATAAKIHANRNKEVQAWAEAGRKAKESQAASLQPTQDTAKKPQQQDVALKPIDVEALKAEYGDEALIERLTGPLNATIDRINQMMPVIQQTQHRSAMAQAEMLNRQIDGFFGGKDMTPYHETYGTDTAKLSEKQLAARTKVLEFADYLIGGAAQNGKSLSFDDAMQMAHDAVSGGTKEQAARERIAAQAKARNKGITMRPGARGTNLNSAGKAKNPADLQKRVSQGLKAVFG